MRDEIEVSHSELRAAREDLAEIGARLREQVGKLRGGTRDWGELSEIGAYCESVLDELFETLAAHADALQDDGARFGAHSRSHAIADDASSPG